MPLHTNTPGERTLVFIQPKNGKFLAQIDGQPQEFEAIEGTLDLVRLEFDPGNPTYKIQPYDAFIMHIADEDMIYRIKMPVNRNFTFSVAKVLEDIQKGDRIIAKAKAGSDPTVTFCNMLKLGEDGNWVRPVSREMPDDKDKKIALIRTIVESHSAYSEKKEKE